MEANYLEIESMLGLDEPVRRPGEGERIVIFDNAFTRRGSAHSMPNSILGSLEHHPTGRLATL